MEPIVLTDLTYYYALAHLKLGNMEQSIEHLRTATTTSKNIGSHLYFNKSSEVYRDMKRKWGQEDKVKELDELFVL